MHRAEAFLYAKQDVTFSRAGYVIRGHECRVAVEADLIIYRNGWSDPAVLRECEVASFIEMLSGH